MKLLLDIGNSSVNWAMEDGGQFTIDGAFRYDKNNFDKDLQDNLSSVKTPTQVLVANVAGKKIFDCLETWMEQQWQLKCWQPRVCDKFNQLKNSYINTQEMGIDRWLAMVAAWEKYQVTLCVVGCGTALTIDSIDSHGNHLGGYIIPGIELMQQALITKTECINVPIDKHASIDYAQNTQSAINNGAFLATTTMVDRVVMRLSDKLKAAPKCIIFGGMAELISPLLQVQFENEPNLVLSGLLIVHRAS
ncbi:MAG: type III pantothenate kinase [marine bacterium B5-7]|nr:MAG: type III pantothenate kinase [marine bacterium B5-7]